MTRPDDTMRVVVVPASCDYQVVLDNVGAGRVLASADKAGAAEVLASHLRQLSQEALADLWERC